MAKVQTEFSEAISKWIQAKFPLYGTRFSVFSETKMYRKMEDEGIWAQTKGILPEVAEVWLRLDSSDEFVCDIISTMPETAAFQRVVNGLEDIKTRLSKQLASKTGQVLR